MIDPFDPCPAEILRILQRPRSVALVGVSADPVRRSGFGARRAGSDTGVIPSLRKRPP